MSRNLLFLLVDQWPAFCFGHRGSDIETPTIDRLAEEGTVFTNAFTTCPLCSPARGTLFTSKWQTQNGMKDNLNVGYSVQDVLSSEETTWLDAGVAKGYHVGYYGKWHLGEDGPKLRGVHGHPQVTEEGHKARPVASIQYDYGRCAQGYFEEGKQLSFGKPPFYGTIGETVENSNPFQVVDQALDFIDDYSNHHSHQPFQLTVSINDPHFPHYLPEGFIECLDMVAPDLPINLEDDFKDKPWFHNKAWWPSMATEHLTKEDWGQVVQYAYAHRMLVDRALGRVIDALEAKDLLKETTIIFTSDHGDMCGAHNRFDKGPYFYEEVWRIPLIIRTPQKFRDQEETFVNLMDIGRSVFDFLGADKPDAEGKSIWPLLSGQESENQWPETVFGMYELYNGMSFRIRAIRNRQYKYIYNPQSVDEFYDLENDPYELTNLASWGKVEEKKDRMKDQLLNWMASIDDPLLEDLKSLVPAGTILINGKAGP